MDEEKRKNDAPQQFTRSPFVAWWAGSGAGLWMVLSIVLENRAFSWNILSVPISIFIIIGMTFITTMLQRHVVERFLRWPLNGWDRFSTLGSVLSIFVFSITQSNNLLTSSLALILPVVLFQTIWLWRHVKLAWVWPLTSLITVWLFVLPIYKAERWWGSGTISFIVLFLGLIHGALQAVIMRHLWTQPKDTEKPKPDVVTEEKPDLERIQRLQEEAEEQISPHKTEHYTTRHITR